MHQFSRATSFSFLGARCFSSISRHRALITGCLFGGSPVLLEPQTLGFSMLSRGNSGAASRLRRAKSASSVQTYRPEPNDTTSIDPEIAYQHALVAASVAFEQAHARGVKIKSRGEGDNVASSVDTNRSLGHRQSIRFTGPSAVPVKERPITRRQAADHKFNLERSKSSRDAQHSRQEPSLRTSDSFVTALPDQNEEYVERRVSSIPSSYRRLRKTKSMINPGKGSAMSSLNGLSRSRGHSRNPSLRLQNNDHHRRASQDSRLRRSLSFLRQPTTSPEPPRKSIDQDKAVQIARDQFVRQLEQQRLKDKTSVVDIGQQRKSAKPFRRTVRTSSTNSYGSAIASPAAEALELPKSTGLGRKARSLSISLKSRLKRVFQKPSVVEETMPAQQLNASRAHFGEFMSTFNGTQQRYEHHIPSPDGDALRRVDSRGSTFRETSAFVEQPSHPGSIRSIESDGSVEKDKSRVSSWETSTIANSLATLQSRENKRLSTINEGAPYQPSSMRSYGNLVNNFAAPTDPIRDYSAGSLYSRLRREIENNERKARDEEDALQAEERPGKGSKQIADLTPRGSSLGTQQRGGVRMSKSVFFNPAATKSTQQPKISYTNHIDVQDRPDSRSNIMSQDLAECRDAGGSPSKRPLREVRSAFFPPSIHLERNSTSPYRQAVRGSNEDDVTPKKEMRSPNASKTNFTSNEQSNLLRVRNFTDSDSIYSRTTSGNTPRASDSPSSSSESGDQPGTAIVASKPMRYDQSSSPSHNRKTSSVQSSGDWKRWLSTEVAQLERQGTAHKQAHVVSSASAMGHKRENAQLDDDDVEIGRLRVVNDMPMQPIAQQQGNSHPRPVLVRQGTSDSMVERYPLLDIGTPHANLTGSQSRAKTPLPIQSRKQSDAEQESPQSVRTLRSTGELRSKPSHASLKNQSSNSAIQKRYGMSIIPPYSRSPDTLRTPSPRIGNTLQTSENSGNRHSAEREARLRRMQSSNSLDPRRNQENRPFGSSETKGSDDGRSISTRPPLMTARSAGSVNQKEGSQSMIQHFLGNRRRDMRISEESGGDPAFL